MYKIDRKHYDINLNIFKGANPSYSGILQGECRGEVYVDTIDRPSISLVFSDPVGGFSIMGETDDSSRIEDLCQYIRQDLFPDFKAWGWQGFEFSFEKDQTRDQFLALFSDFKLDLEDEYFYTCQGTCPPIDIPGYVIKRLDSALLPSLQEGKIDGGQEVLDKIIYAWHSLEDFIKRSVGYLVLSGDHVAGIIIGSARFDNHLVIDIKTIEGHRKKGLAYWMTQHFLKACHDQNLIAHWNCVDSNTGSKRTAEKAGFQLNKIKPYYWLPFENQV